MKGSILKLIELQQSDMDAILNGTIQRTITIWLTTQLNTHTQKMPAPFYRRRHFK